MKKRKTEKNHREWLVKTIAMYGGPPNCTDEFVIKDDLLVIVSTQAVFYFQGVIMTDNDVTVGEYLQMLKRHFPESSSI